MSHQLYLTIAKNHQHEITIKKSHFICSLARISSEQDAQGFIAKVSANNRKANHNCFAYMVGADDHIQRESDNGEPSGTAGVPILESLQLMHVHDVCAVVTRYFGGIKLGAGGLIRAYSNVTSEALHDAGLVQRVEQELLQIDVPYNLHDKLLYFLKENNLQTVKEDYGVNVTTSIFVNDNQVEQVIQDLTNRFNNQLTIKKAGKHFNEIPYSK